MIIDRKCPDRIIILPSIYRDMGINQNVQHFYRRLTDGMTIICGWENHDGQWWLHVSCAKTKLKTIPKWADLVEVKNIFVGKDKKAIQVLPENKYYVNVNPYCLHLFYSDEYTLPEFSTDNLL